MPIEPPEREKIAVLMPTSLPVMSTSGAAGIAGIDRRIGLDEELIVGDADLGAGDRRDDAVGHGLPDAERIADREHQIADLEARRSCPARRSGNRSFLALIRSTAEIGTGILQHDFGLELALVGERHLHLVWRPR